MRKTGGNYPLDPPCFLLFLDIQPCTEPLYTFSVLFQSSDTPLTQGCSLQSCHLRWCFPLTPLGCIQPTHPPWTQKSVRRSRGISAAYMLFTPHDLENMSNCVKASSVQCNFASRTYSDPAAKHQLSDPNRPPSNNYQGTRAECKTGNVSFLLTFRLLHIIQLD